MRAYRVAWGADASAARIELVSRKALCTLGYGPHAALLSVSEPTFAAYADRHGYELVVADTIDASRPPAWSKIPLLRAALADHEIAVWIDADAVIVDHSVDIADALGAECVLGLVRHAYEGHLAPNSGVMVMRRDPLTAQLLDTVWAATAFLHHPMWENAAIAQALGYSLPGTLGTGYRGRLHRIAKRVLGRELRRAGPVRPTRLAERTEFLPNEWNSISYDPATHARIVHCPGARIEDRLQYMSAVLQAAGA